MSISGWFYDHSFGLLGTKDGDPGDKTKTTPSGKTVDANDPDADDSDDSGINGILKMLKNVWKYLAAIVNIIKDISTGDYGAAAGEVEKVFSDTSSDSSDSSYVPAAGNAPSTFHTVRNWVASRAAPAADLKLVHDTALSNGLEKEDALALSTIIQGESAWDRYARSPKSSAKGRFQFLDATAKALGVSDPYDPTESTLGGIKLYKDIRQGLADALHDKDITKVSHADIYLGWMWGKNGAIHLLQGDANASAADALKAAGMSNPVEAIGNNLTDAEKAANPNWQNMTKGQLVGLIEGKYNEREKAFLAIPSNAAMLNMAPGAAPGAPAPATVAGVQPPQQQPAAPQLPIVAPNLGANDFEHKKVADLRGAPPAPTPGGSTPPRQEVADMRSPQPVPHVQERRDYRGLHVAIKDPEPEVAVNIPPKTGKVVSIDGGRGSPVPGQEEPAA